MIGAEVTTEINLWIAAHDAAIKWAVMVVACMLSVGTIGFSLRHKIGRKTGKTEFKR